MSTQPQCPKCGTELNEEFGMVTCPGCGSVIFIDFEGQAQLQVQDPSPDETPADPAPAAYEEPAASFGHEPAPVDEPTPVDEAVIESFANYESMSPLAGEIAVEPSSDGSFQPAYQDETPNTPLDISEFANSEASQAKDGPLTYTLYIEGVDSKELRDSLREALSESRFGWDFQALMASVREGNLTLKAIEPVKASVLVNRLKRLPLKIWWEQNAITDPGRND